MAVRPAALDPRPQPWYVRGRETFLRFWRSKNPRVSAVRDVAVAAGVVLLLLGVIWAYTGQSFPTQAPLVVVESGSMMHGPYGPCLRGTRECAAFDRPVFGRMGTIDPGDLVLVKKVDSFDDIETAFGSGSRGGYGAHGDVLIYKRPNGGDTPVIHRALLKVFVTEDGCQPGPADGTGCVYQIPETCDAATFETFVQPRSGASDWRAYCQGSREPLTMDLLRDGVFLSLTNYPCGTTCNAEYRSGIITKGDNNQFQDQPAPYAGDRFPSGIACCPIRMEWVVGKARGEVPWFGLIKLALYGNARYQCGEGQACSDPTRDTQWTFVRATAPWDIWVMLFVAIGVLVAAPVGIDYLMAQWRRRRGGKPTDVEPAVPRAAEPPPPEAPSVARKPAAPPRRPKPASRRRTPPQR